MPLICCPHCGWDTLALSGWATIDHCANCGQRLATPRLRAAQMPAVTTPPETAITEPAPRSTPTPAA